MCRTLLPLPSTLHPDTKYPASPPCPPCADPAKSTEYGVLSMSQTLHSLQLRLHIVNHRPYATGNVRCRLLLWSFIIRSKMSVDSPADRSNSSPETRHFHDATLHYTQYNLGSHVRCSLQYCFIFSWAQDSCDLTVRLDSVARK